MSTQSVNIPGLDQTMFLFPLGGESRSLAFGIRSGPVCRVVLGRAAAGQCPVAPVLHPTGSRALQQVDEVSRQVHLANAHMEVCQLISRILLT